MKALIQEFYKGLFKENPVLVIALGLCPALAVSNSMENAIGMGIAATFVLICSNAIVASLRNLIPAKIRIPCFIVVIASFVTVVELVMAAYLPELAKRLGIFVPLIVVNCIILGRAEAFASKNSVIRSIADGLGMGIGFTFALSLIAFFREVLGAGKFFGYPVFTNFEPAIALSLAPGALLIIGLIMGFIQWKKSS